MDLVSRAKARDREAFEMLVVQYATEMYRLAAAIVGIDEPPSDPGDVRHRLAAARETPRCESFRAWLRRICVNRSRNWLRTHGRRPRAALDLREQTGMADPGPDFRADAESRAILEPAFESLTPDQRAVLALHYSLGHSISEAADLLGSGSERRSRGSAPGSRPSGASSRIRDTTSRRRW